MSWSLCWDRQWPLRFTRVFVDAFRFRRRGGLNYLGGREYVWRCIGGGGHLGTYVPPSEGEDGESGRILQTNVTVVSVLFEFTKDQIGLGRLGD